MLRSVCPDCKTPIEQVKHSTTDGGGAGLQIGDPRESVGEPPDNDAIRSRFLGASSWMVSSDTCAGSARAFMTGCWPPAALSVSTCASGSGDSLGQHQRAENTALSPVRRASDPGHDYQVRPS